MRIDADLCTGCKNCLIYCPVSAINEVDGAVKIDEDACVECKVCIRSGCCASEAFFQPELAWPRILRSLFSDPITVHPDTGVAGRGTEEIKTNDVTNRFGWGEVGLAVELGRPSTGTNFEDIEIISKRLALLGVYFEPANPVTKLFSNISTGKIRNDVKNERVLTAIIEFKVPEAQISEVLTVLKEVSQEINTVYSLDIINRYQDREPIYAVEVAGTMGFPVSLNGKVCLNLGRVNS